MYTDYRALQLIFVTNSSDADLSELYQYIANSENSIPLAVDNDTGQ